MNDSTNREMAELEKDMLFKIIVADLEHKRETGWSCFEEPQKEEGAQDEKID